MTQSASPSSIPSQSAPGGARLLAIDALRGLVMLIMLLDHVRDTVYLHLQVPDPLIAGETPVDLFASRLLAHVCAPVFVFLTGLSAWLYGNRYTRSGQDGRAAAAAFLFKRGLFLVLLEISVINFAWTFEMPPTRMFLQVIWVIGLSMMALSALLWLPRAILMAVALALVAGHNLLDAIHFSPEHALYIPWAVLHDRVWIVVSETLRIRTSYPLLPWVGVIALGWLAAPAWFGRHVHAPARQQQLLRWGVGLLLGFVVLRGINVYGDKPWVADDSTLISVMSFVNISKYPPSLLFVMLTLGVGLLLLRWLERSPPDAVWLRVFVVFGSVPMFFYILHLYVLKALYLSGQAIWGNNKGDYFGFDAVWQLWVCAAILAWLMYPVVKAFARFKARRRDLVWLKYL